jgi:hypothetical protein
VLIGTVGAMMGLPSVVSAWGKEGHEIVGKIAEKHLSSQARAAIDDLLSTSQFPSIGDGRLANWADAVKHSSFFQHKYPKNNLYHFIDIDIDADLASLALSSFCQSENCALSALEKFRTVLKNPSASQRDRVEALFFIVHILGDIHQPLHCAEHNQDHGGNLVQVQLHAGDHHATNLHSVWDTELVREAMGNLTIADYAARLISALGMDKRKEYQKGGLQDWILESHKIAREKVYKLGVPTGPAGAGPVVLTSNYLQDGTDIVEIQLMRGGVRLAQFLNDTFKE